MTGTERQFNGDLHAYWDQLGILPGQFAERMVAWKQLPQNAAWIDATEDADAAEVVDGLWKAGEQGVGFDASDLSTMFQDAAGTLPVYAPGQGQVDPPVGRILDRSGRGNHAYQTTTTSRPVLSARYNALSASERFDDAYWGFTSTYAVEKTGDVQDPSGRSNAWKITATTGSGALNKVVGAGFKNPVYTVILRAGSRNPDILVRNATTTTNLVGGSTSSPSTSGTYGKFTNADLGGGWRKLTIEITSGVATSDVLIIYLGSTGSVATGQYFYAYRAEFREGNDGIGLPEYQRVVDATTYDTVGFPLYLKFDGVDDFLQTAAVDFSGTDKIFLASTLRKLSDASTGIVAELTTNSSNFAGTFMLAAPSANGVNKFRFSSKGTVQADAATTASIYSAPYGAIVACSGDIGGAKASLRVNGAVAATSSAAQGTGNFTSAVLYIGRRGDATTAFNGRLYSLLIRGAATLDALIAKIERYLNQKARIY